MSTDSPYEKARQYVEHHNTDRISGKMRYINGPCITISRETGAGANFLCDALMELFTSQYPLNDCPWAVFDKTLLDLVIADHNLPEKMRAVLGEQKYATISTMMNELLGVHPPLIKLHKQLTETILKLAHTGYCIIVGRGANFITSRLKNTTHIRLIAPYDCRLEHMRKHYQMDTKTAADFIKTEDARRKKYVETYFYKDPDDPHYYDLTINTGELRFTEAAALIAAYLQIKNS